MNVDRLHNTYVIIMTVTKQMYSLFIVSRQMF